MAAQTLYLLFSRPEGKMCFVVYLSLAFLSQVIENMLETKTATVQTCEENKAELVKPHL